MRTDTRSRRDIVRQLASAQKSSRGAAPYSRWVNRSLGRHLAAAAYLLGWRPNQVSALSGAFTFVALLSVATLKPSWPLAVAVTVLLLTGYALDSADGQLARLRGGGSIAGEWLDHVLDAIKACVFHLVVLVAWWRFFHVGRPVWLLVPIAYCVVSSVFFFAMILSDMLRRIQRTTRGGTAVTTASVNPNEPAPIFRSLIVVGGDYGVLCLSMLFWSVRIQFMVLYTVLFAMNACYIAIGLMRWFREMSQLDVGVAGVQ